MKVLWYLLRHIPVALAALFTMLTLMHLMIAAKELRKIVGKKLSPFDYISTALMLTLAAAWLLYLQASI